MILDFLYAHWWATVLASVAILVSQYIVANQSSKAYSAQNRYQFDDQAALGKFGWPGTGLSLSSIQAQWHISYFTVSVAVVWAICHMLESDRVPAPGFGRSLFELMAGMLIGAQIPYIVQQADNMLVCRELARRDAAVGQLKISALTTLRLMRNSTAGTGLMLMIFALFESSLFVAGAAAICLGYALQLQLHAGKVARQAGYAGTDEQITG